MTTEIPAAIKPHSIAGAPHMSANEAFASVAEMPGSPSGVYMVVGWDGRVVGADPDRNIRFQLMRDAFANVNYSLHLPRKKTLRGLLAFSFQIRKTTPITDKSRCSSCSSMVITADIYANFAHNRVFDFAAPDRITSKGATD